MNSSMAALPRSRLHPLVALAIGAVLWELQGLRPAQQAISELFQNLGWLSSEASAMDLRFTGAMVLRWISAGLLVAVVVWLERLPVRSIGIYPPKRIDLMWAFDAGILAAVVGIGLFLLVQGFRPGIEAAAERTVASLSVWGRLQLIANAAVVEELFFRSFLIERSMALLRRPWLAGGISFVLFIAAHWAGSGQIETLTIVTVSAFVFTALYVWRRNLFLCIIAHAVANAPILFS